MSDTQFIIIDTHLLYNVYFLRIWEKLQEEEMPMEKVPGKKYPINYYPSEINS